MSIEDRQELVWEEVCGQQALKAPERGSQGGQPGEGAQAGGLRLALVWPMQCFRKFKRVAKIENQDIAH